MDSESVERINRPVISAVDSTTLSDLINGKCPFPADAHKNHRNSSGGGSSGGVAASSAGAIDLVSNSFDVAIDYPVYDASFPSIDIEHFQPIRNHTVMLDINEDLPEMAFFKIRKTTYQTSKAKGKKRRAITSWVPLFEVNLRDSPSLNAELNLVFKITKLLRGRQLFILPPLTLDLDLIEQEMTEAQLPYAVFKGSISFHVGLPLNVDFGSVSASPLIFKHLLPNITRNDSGVSPQEFYQTISRSDREVDIPKSLPVKGLICKLLRYQKETVQWCLRREGKEYDEERELLIDYNRFPSEQLELGWYKLPGNDKIWVNPYIGRICDWEGLKKYSNQSRQFLIDNNIGAQGLLAEEMGLGKTIEILAMVLLHRRNSNDIKNGPVFDHFLNRDILPAKTTLIISPRSISKQWEEEIIQHAPEVSILVYKGKHFTESVITPEEMASYDIIITTYTAISSEIHYALYDPTRPTRSHVVEQRSMTDYLSPLMKIQFWRVVLDEVQMVSGGISNAARVAKLIPRVHAWGVTGTPVKKDMQDLKGILNFLRLNPWGVNEFAYNQLLTTPEDFKALFSHIGIRHTTAMVEDDIALPPQSRNLASLPFTTIESDNYSQLYKAFLVACNLTENGEKINESKPIDMSNMASWLIRLRQACCHPKFGGGIRQRNIGGGNTGGGKEVKTIEEVLTAMVDQAFTEMLAEQRKKDLSMLNRGRVLLESLREKEKALKVFEETTYSVEQTVEDLRTRLTTLQEEKRKADEEKRIKREEISAEPDLKNESNRLEDDEDEDYDDGDEDGGDYSDIVKTMSNRLRHWLELLHRCYFFVATTHYQLYKKEDLENENQGGTELPSLTEEELHHQKLESEFYSKAQKLRRELLQESIQKVSEVTQRLKSYDFVKLNEWEGREMELSKLTLDQDQIQLLVEQSIAISEWRSKLIEYLSKDVVDANADPDGQEYEDSLNSQEYAFTYLEVFQKILSDRSLIITGRSDPLLKGTVERTTDNTSSIKKENNDSGEKPEDDLLKLLNKRVTSLKPKSYGFGISWSPLSSKMAYYRKQKTSDLEIATFEQFSELYEEVKNELLQLTKEVRVFRTCYNRRVGYYKQLQQMSDNVGEVNLTQDAPSAHLQDQINKEIRLEAIINQKRGRQRYLESLWKSTNQSADDAERICTICQNEYKLGSWTVCGHEFCRECLEKWLSHHGTCPICKSKVSNSEVYSLTYLTQAEREKGGGVLNGEDNKNLSTKNGYHGAIYKPVKRALIETIKSSVYSSFEHFGTKIDYMMRHLKWLRLTEPGAQVVVFSQWAEMLRLFGIALSHNKFKYATVDQGMDQFKLDTSFACFLLHAKSQS